MVMGKLSNEPFGKQLAIQIAELLKQGFDIYHSHRDYCGMGLWFENGSYCYGDVWDAYPQTLKRHFTSEEEFVYWLGEQSDLSLCGLEESDSWLYNNQRITRKRLESALAKNL